MYLCKIKVHSSGSFAAQPSLPLYHLYKVHQSILPPAVLFCDILPYWAHVSHKTRRWCSILNECKACYFCTDCRSSPLKTILVQSIQNFKIEMWKIRRKTSACTSCSTDKGSESVYYDYLTCFVCWGAFIGTTLKSKWGKFHTLFLTRVLTSDEYPGDPLHGRGHPVVRGADVEAAVVPRHVAQLRHHRAPQLLPTSCSLR